MDDLTARQRQICETFARLQSELGTQPSIHRMMVALEVTSSNAMLDHYKAIQKKGYMDRAGGGSYRASWLLTDKWWSEASGEAHVTVMLSAESVELLKERKRIVARAGGKTIEICIREVV